jgi:hypothetical protein
MPGQTKIDCDVLFLLLIIAGSLVIITGIGMARVEAQKVEYPYVSPCEDLGYVAQIQDWPCTWRDVVVRTAFSDVLLMCRNVPPTSLFEYMVTPQSVPEESPPFSVTLWGSPMLREDIQIMRELHAMNGAWIQKTMQARRLYPQDVAQPLNIFQEVSASGCLDFSVDTHAQSSVEISRLAADFRTEEAAYILFVQREGKLDFDLPCVDVFLTAYWT